MRHALRNGRGHFARAGSDGAILPAAGAQASVERAEVPALKPVITTTPPVQVAWSAAREDAFFRELSEVCNVNAAARAAGFPDSRPAYNRKERGGAFRARWDGAVAEGYARLELEMLERARFGENRRADQGCSGEKQRAIPTSLALSLLKMHQARAKAAPSAVAPTARPMRGQSIRDEMEKRFREISQRLTERG